MTKPTTPHLDDETLSAFLTETLGAMERRQVDDHLQSCGACKQLLGIARRRMSLASQAGEPVPQKFRERATEAIRESMPAPRATQPQSKIGTAARPATTIASRGESWSERIANWFSLPVLVPVAVAMVGLLVVVSKMPNDSSNNVRSLHIHERAYVTNRTEARAEPNDNAASVTTLQKGDAVELLDEKHGWYRVRFADTREGWVDARDLGGEQ